ncbi:MAG: hypothetical protein ACLR0U_08635 [Enterocloster clostridioformis]
MLLDGKILGIPMTAGYEYVYYWKDMFEEAVSGSAHYPQDQLKEVSETLQDYYGKDNPDFMAIALGAKDEWPDYSVHGVRACPGRRQRPELE